MKRRTEYLLLQKAKFAVNLKKIGFIFLQHCHVIVPHPP